MDREGGGGAKRKRRHVRLKKAEDKKNERVIDQNCLFDLVPNKLGAVFTRDAPIQIPVSGIESINLQILDTRYHSGARLW